MQSKVSMVMPCFNKVEYIGEMFDSIIAQNWNNIELIFVNDGSTDGTREIITEYVSKFRARGYDVVIIDQENKGVCAAAQAGLERITGDYVCMVDADDELSPVYVSTMAGWLDYDTSCDYCVCGVAEYTGSGDKKNFIPDWSRGLHYSDPYIAQRWIFGVFRTNPWIYMLRKSYLYKCNILNTYYTATNGSHEPAYIIPILAYAGKFQYLPLPLYHFNINGESHSRSNKFDRMKKYHEEYSQLCKIAIEHLPKNVASTAQKINLIGCSLISALIRTYRFALCLQDGKEHTQKIMELLIAYVNKNFQFEKAITVNQTLGSEEALFRCLIGILTGKTINRVKRVIAYGALGAVASKYIPLLKETPLEPTMLWDKNGDGHIVKKPDFNSLGAGDALLIFPKRKVFDEIFNEIKDTGCSIIQSDDILSFIDISAGSYNPNTSFTSDTLRFPQFLTKLFYTEHKVYPLFPPTTETINNIVIELGKSKKKDKTRIILLLTHDLSISGAQIALQNAAHAIIGNGDLPIICSTIGGPLLPVLLKENIFVIIDSLFFESELFLELVSFSEIIIVNTLTPITLTAIKKLNGLSIPVLWWIHESKEYCLTVPRDMLPKHFEKNIYVYCVSEYARKVLLSIKEDIPAELLVYGIKDFYENYQASYNDRIRIMTIGVMCQRKGQDILCEAIRKLDESTRKKCDFIFVGALNNLEPVYQIVISLKNEFPDNVIVTGEIERERIGKFLHQCDCMICASRDDPMPIFIAEAMMFQKICICSENTGYIDIIEDGVSGFIYNQNSADELCSKLEYYVMNKSRLAKMKIKSRQVYENHFSFSKFSKKLISILDMIEIC